MLSHQDLYKTASVMIELHGDEAEDFSATRANDFLDQGDIEGSLTWTRIMLIVAEINNPENNGALH